MKVAVLHSSLNPCGGAERVCLHTIRAFKEEGFKVALATLDATDWARVEALTGCKVKPDYEYHLLPARLPIFGIYQRLAVTLWLAKLRSRVDLTVNTHGDCLPLPCDAVYIHFPTLVDSAYIDGNPVNAKYSTSTFWKLYFQPYKTLQKSMVKNYLREAGKILTNSSYSAEAIKAVTGCEARIVYPPVDVERFLEASGGDDRENLAITVSRITPEKGLELLPRVASRIPHMRFILIGALSGFVSRSLLSELVKAKPRNLEVKVSLPLGSVVKVYSRAKVYLHLMKGEHFGISVVEGMAAGLIPVVHRSGGCYKDIIAENRYGFSWETPEEIVDAVGKALEAEHLRPKVIARAKEFSAERFRRNLIREILG